jgi:hypothetical protein
VQSAFQVEAQIRLAGMPINFLDSETNKELGSTLLAKRVLLAASSHLPEMKTTVENVTSWRKEYLGVFAELAVCEGKSLDEVYRISKNGLQELARCVFSDEKLRLYDSVKQGWDHNNQDVLTVSITGTGISERVSVAGHSGKLADLASLWVDQQLAEPGLIKSFEYLDTHPNVSIKNDLLVALAGAAEFAPTEYWLRWGGKVAMVARSKPSTWLNFIQLARSSGGELLLPVLKSKMTKPLADLSDEELANLAGLDLIEHHRETSGWISQLAMKAARRLVLGCYAYAPGVNHIKVQCVQDALIETAMAKLDASNLAISWLATPTDSAPGPREISIAQQKNYASRSVSRVIRDSLLGAFGQARPARPRDFLSDTGEELTLIDSSVQQQGPSYSFSKRTQRWRAYLANEAGVRVSYAISPPARTNSVLSHRILRASYRGAPFFGIQPFEVATSKSAIAAVLVRDLNDDSLQPETSSTVALHTASAIHGGLWRVAYNPKTVWIIATIIGLPALLLG